LPTIRYIKIVFVKKFLPMGLEKDKPHDGERLQNPTEGRPRAEPCAVPRFAGYIEKIDEILH